MVQIIFFFCLDHHFKIIYLVQFFLFSKSMLEMTLSSISRGYVLVHECSDFQQQFFCSQLVAVLECTRE